MRKYILKLMHFIYSKKTVIQFLFFIFLCVLIHLWFLQYFYYFADNLRVIMSISRRKNMIEQYPNDAIFILVWNKYNNILQRFGIKNGLINCSISDCVFTDDKNLLYDYRRYDAIVMNEFILNSIDRPNKRSKFQFYVFSSQKSSSDAPACDNHIDNFFNMTFTYKVDSTALWSYVAVQNLSGALVAPKVSVEWKTSLKPISSDIKSVLRRKIKAAIWIVNYNKRLESSVEYITSLQEHLFQYSLKIDVYGESPMLRCPNNDCQKTIQDKYYFYMAFENSFSADYVTDIVLNGYNNYAVPVVYGGANYSRFLPPGSYINAGNIHPYNLAHMMHKTIQNPVLYEAYFRWRNIYVIKDNSKSRMSLCNLCDTIKKSKANGTQLENKHFRRWWNGLNGMKRCLSEAYWNEKANLNVNHIFNSK